MRGADFDSGAESGRERLFREDAAEEKKCPDFELDQLVEIRDVSKDVQGAMAGKTGDEANKALHAKEAELQQSCGSDRSVRCDVVSLYHGESTICTGTNATTTCAWCLRRSFGGAIRRRSGHFNFPRFDYDIGVLRAYEGDKPAATEDYLHWSPNGTKDGDLVFVSGIRAARSVN